LDNEDKSNQNDGYLSQFSGLMSKAYEKTNHPSGNKNPSQADIDITKKIKEVLSYFDCRIIDHIILTKNNYTSFADESII